MTRKEPVISTEAARLTRLINNVLDFARIERGEKKYHFESFDLVRLVRETVDAYRPQLESSGFRIDCNLPVESVEVTGDRDAIAQILLNLISNAEKYSADTKDITVRLRLDGNEAVIEVLDRGIGVPSGCEEKIIGSNHRVILYRLTTDQ